MLNSERVYVTRLDEISSHKIPFLDIWVEKTGLGYEFQPYYKPTGVHVPLDPTSVHQLNTHMHWPTMYLRRLFQNSTTLEQFVHASCVFVERLCKHYFPDVVIARTKAEVQSLITQSNNQRPRRAAQQMGRTIWYKIPFHNCWLAAGVG
eukprot:10543086-Karenia_brevis.AAC.1